MVLDIGGEGRHTDAWNVNVSQYKTLGPARGALIPRLIRGRSENIPLASNSVDVVIVERTPLRLASLLEIRRVGKFGALVILRHAQTPCTDPHERAKKILGAAVSQCWIRIGKQILRQTMIRLN